jgi:hypothetical protein
MPRLQHGPVGPMDPHRFADVLPVEDYEKLLDLIERGARELRGRVIWNVSSTAKGGGVVELVRPLLGYSRGGGVDARWVVIGGEPESFGITKRLHNHLHGFGSARSLIPRSIFWLNRGAGLEEPSPRRRVRISLTDEQPRRLV